MHPRVATSHERLDDGAIELASKPNRRKRAAVTKRTMPPPAPKPVRTKRRALERKLTLAHAAEVLNGPSTTDDSALEDV